MAGRTALFWLMLRDLETPVSLGPKSTCESLSLVYHGIYWKMLDVETQILSCSLIIHMEGGILAPVCPDHKTFSPTLWKSFPKSRVFQRQWLYILSLVSVLVSSSCCVCSVSNPP